MASEFDAFAVKLNTIARDLTGPQMRKALEKVALAAKTEDAPAALRGDLGDTSMSNWRRGNPITPELRYKFPSNTEIEISRTPKSRGPWRVLEEGRQYGASSDLVLVGRARKDGTRRGRSRGRNQSATAGKDTWSDAQALVEKNTPQRALPAIHEVLLESLGGG